MDNPAAKPDHAKADELRLRPVIVVRGGFFGRHCSFS